MLDAKALKKKYGVTLSPVLCTEAWVRSMPFDHAKVNTASYILVNRYTGQRTHVNTYDGVVGQGYDARKNTYPIEDDKRLARTLQLGKERAYVRCLISDCPVAELASPPEGLSPIVEPPLDAPFPVPEKAADVKAEKKAASDPGVGEIVNLPESMSAA